MARLLEVSSLRTAGSIIIRHNIIRNAYNGVRLRANKCAAYEVCGANVEIYDNDFQFVRDNPVEPEDYALNWWIYHNRIYNGHGWFSLDGVSGGPIYIFGNVGWFDDKPAQRCIQRDWAADQTIHAGKRYVPTPEGECSRSRTGKVIKLGPDPVELKEPIYIFNNSWYVRAPLIAGGRAKFRAWNNATEFCDPKAVPPGMCVADFESEPACVQSPAGTGNPFANRFPWGWIVFRSSTVSQPALETNPAMALATIRIFPISLPKLVFLSPAGMETRALSTLIPEGWGQTVSREGRPAS